MGRDTVRPVIAFHVSWYGMPKRQTGMTETSTVVTMMPIGKKHATVGSAGQLLPGCVVRVVKPDGSLAGIGEAGELLVRGPAMALGYANNAEA